jgi:hypothetical protein
MGNLYLELSEKLEKTVPEFREALECGCNTCEDLTQVYITIEYQKIDGVGIFGTSTIEAAFPCEICGKAVAITGRRYQSDNGQTRTVPVCGSCVEVYEASK